VCIARAAYATGPTFTDYLSVIAFIFYHVHLLYAPRRLLATLRSPALTKALVRARRNETSAELLDQLYDTSRLLFFVGCLVVGLVLVIFFVAWLPLYFNDYYLDPSTSVGNKVYAIFSGTLFAIGMTTLVPLGVSVHILSALVMTLSSISVESAADSIAPTVAQLGLLRIHEHEKSRYAGEPPYSLFSTNEQHFLKYRTMAANTMKAVTGSLRRLANATVSIVPMSMRDSSRETTGEPKRQRRGSVADSSILQGDVEEAAPAQFDPVLPPIKLSDEDLLTFQRRWRLATALYRQLQAELRPMHDVFALVSLLCLPIPLELALLSVTDPSFSLDGGYGAVVQASNTIRLFFLWILPALLGSVELAFAARCTFRLRRCASTLVDLTYTRPTDRLLIDHVTQQSNACVWRITCLEVPVSPHGLLLVPAVLAVSALPWAWVRFV